MKQLIGQVIVVVALLTPTLPASQDHEKNQSNQDKRYYDNHNKDWHNWNTNETQAYQRYNQEHHNQDRDFSRLSKKQQQSYFSWRHQHPDDQSAERHR